MLAFIIISLYHSDFRSGPKIRSQLAFSRRHFLYALLVLLMYQKKLGKPSPQRIFLLYRPKQVGKYMIFSRIFLSDNFSACIDQDMLIKAISTYSIQIIYFLPSRYPSRIFSFAFCACSVVAASMPSSGYFIPSSLYFPTPIT